MHSSVPFFRRLLAALDAPGDAALGHRVAACAFVLAAEVGPDGRILDAYSGVAPERIRRRERAVGQHVSHLYAAVPDVWVAVGRALAGETVDTRITLSWLALDLALRPQWRAGCVTAAYALAMPPDETPAAEPWGATSLAAAGLTRAQAVVACGLARGLTPAQIAAAGYVSRSTVYNHIAALKRRLGVRLPGEAVAYGRARGWDTLPFPAERPGTGAAPEGLPLSFGPDHAARPTARR